MQIFGLNVTQFQELTTNNKNRIEVQLNYMYHTHHINRTRGVSLLSFDLHIRTFEFLLLVYQSSIYSTLHFELLLSWSVNCLEKI